MTFVAATNNKGKVEEIKRILENAGHKVLSSKQALVECNPLEDGNSFLENATIKALAFKRLTDFAVIADDSGLMVEALKGEPGIKTARYAGEGCSDEENIKKLLFNMEDVNEKERTAWFVAAVVAVLKNNETVSALGYTRGYIGYEKRGTNGFGYDPIFYIDGDISFAELSSERKNNVSHRGRALRKLEFKLKGIKRMRKIQ